MGVAVGLPPYTERYSLDWMDRLNPVVVSTGGGDIRISWDARNELLERVRRLQGGDAVVAAFEAVGATSPVQLDRDGTILVLDLLEDWLQAPTDVGAAPAGIVELRNALASA